MLTSIVAFTQNRVVTGRVTDDKGAPVEGATVKVKGSKRGVAADLKGNFKLSISGSQLLVVSAVGFVVKEVQISNSDNLNVILERAGTELTNVVVTALGIRRNRNELTYAAQQVTGDEVSKQRSSNFLSNLSGKVSGLESRQSNSMGGSINILLRGSKTIGSSNQPLFVIDGVPFDNSNVNGESQAAGRGGYDYGNAAADINPDDIESITVLKGAASTALYGSRGGNGVILITTKQNKAGKRSLGITINSGVTVGSIDKSTFVKYQREYGGGYGPFYVSDRLFSL